MNSEKLPLVTIIIATFNSEKVLPLTLAAIRKQSYPKDLIEIFAIDGGSKDNTIKIAEEYGCIIYDNPKKDPGDAKWIGIKNARGKYLVTIDHDEVMSNTDSIRNKVEALQANPLCKVAFCSGYRRPTDYPGLNEYISEFGDPFSLFFYKFSKGEKYYIKALSKVGDIIFQNDRYAKIHINSLDRIIVELMCMGTMLDMEFFTSTVPLAESRYMLSHGFYEMVDRGFDEVAVVKEDPLVHYSIDSIKAYLPKLRYRIINNVHYAERNVIGFGGREKAAKNRRLRKYAFVMYSVSIIAPLCDSVYLSLSRRNPSFMWHLFLSLYTTYYIVIQYVLKVFGVHPALKTYDGKERVDSIE